MECLGVFYSHNSMPNDAELQGCIDIAAKFKHPVLLYFQCAADTHDTTVKHVFIFPDDTLATVRLRISAGYEIK